MEMVTWSPGTVPCPPGVSPNPSLNQDLSGLLKPSRLEPRPLAQECPAGLCRFLTVRPWLPRSLLLSLQNGCRGSSPRTEGGRKGP